MKSYTKTIIAIAAITTMAVAAASPVQAKSKWKKGLATGIGVGVGLGVVGALINNNHRQRDRVVYVERPRCYIDEEPLYDRYGRVVAYRDVKVCN